MKLTAAFALCPQGERGGPPWRRTALSTAASLLLTAAAAAPARADCESGVERLVTKLATVSDSHVRSLLQADLNQAQIDLWEFDEVECAMVLDHATRVLLLAAQPPK